MYLYFVHSYTIQHSLNTPNIKRFGQRAWFSSVEDDFRPFLVLMAVLASQGAEGQRGPLRPNDARYRLQRNGSIVELLKHLC